MRYCPKCAGSGRIPNPDYPDSVRTLDRRYESGFLPYPHYERELVNRYGSLEGVPEEFISCPICRGSGRESIRSRSLYHGA